MGKVVKIALVSDDMILYIHDSQNNTRNLLETMKDLYNKNLKNRLRKTLASRKNSDAQDWWKK